MCNQVVAWPVVIPAGTQFCVKVEGEGAYTCEGSATCGGSVIAEWDCPTLRAGTACFEVCASGGAVTVCVQIMDGEEIEVTVTGSAGGESQSAKLKGTHGQNCCATFFLEAGMGS